MNNLIEISLRIAIKAHSNQKDKAGEEYILHPLRIMAKMDTTEEKCVALLHDVIEDSNYTEEDLLLKGIPKKVVNAVVHLSRKPDESYSIFINRVLTNTLASKVKRADLEDNLNTLRLKTLSKDDLNRIKKYHSAWKKINNSGVCNG